MAPEPKEIAKGIADERRRSRVRDDARIGPKRMADDPTENVLRLSTGETLYQHITALAERQDGYIRIIPDGSSKSVYLKYKYTRGEWKGYYLMAVVEVWDIEHGMLLLRQKVDSVDVGIKRPAKDTAYDN